MMFGKKVSNEEVKKDVLLDCDSANMLHYYILYDRLGGVPIYSPFTSRNDKSVIRSVANIMETDSFKFKPNEVSLYHIYTMNESDLTVSPDKRFICYLDDVPDLLKQIQEDL